MKFTSSLVSFVVLAISAAAVQAAPAATRGDAVVPDTRLDELREQLQRYETPIIHAYLARAALGGSVESEAKKTANVLEGMTKTPEDLFAQPDKNVASFLESNDGKKFRGGIFPPATIYNVPSTLRRDTVLDQPVVGVGIFPTGRRPQDPYSVVEFVWDKLQGLRQDAALDSGVAALLDASILRLVSARIMLGYEIGMAKFQSRLENYCNWINNDTPEKAKEEITQDVTYVKQEVSVLGRVRDKAKAFSQLFRQDPEYPVGAADDVLRLFQAYIIPITKELEVKTILDQAAQCTIVAAKKP